MLTCGVATPGLVGLGGYGGSAVIYLSAEDKIIAVDFDSRAPLQYRADKFAGERKKYETGYLSITVPAVVAGLELMLQRFGTLTWSAVSKPATRLAADGVQITPHLKRQIDDWVKKADARSLRALFPTGVVPARDMIWCQPDMARLLRRLALDGPRSLYEGDIPRAIVRQVQENGGILTEEDFGRYQAQLVDPVAIEYRGYRVLTPPPPSGGITSLQILKTLEQFDLAKMQPWGTDYFHLFVEATKIAWQDRAKHLGDPDATQIPYDELLGSEKAIQSAARMRQNGTDRSPGATAKSPHHTVNIVAADSIGNVVSLTATHGYLFGSTVAIAGLGLVMGHGMSRFDLVGGGPNAPVAGKRMFHNMAPTVILRPDGNPRAAVGLPGGPKIVTVTAQLVVNLVDFQVPPTIAVSSGRVHVESEEPVSVSAAVPDAIIEELRSRGHTVRRGQEVGGPPHEIGGPANALVIDPETDEISAATQSDDY